MATEKYNGWASYETWLVSVWEGIDSLADEAQEQNLKEVTSEWCEETFMELIDHLMPHKKFDANIMTDLLRSAILRIDWREIQEHVNEQIPVEP